jgi:membrane protein
VVVLLTWLYLSCYVLLFGGELNSEIECQTKIEAGAAPQAGSAGVPALPAPPARPALPAPRGAETAGSGFVASRVGARAGRVAGLPKIGWISSGLASMGLAMLRKPGRKTTGAALLATAAGISLLRARD